MGGCSSKAGDAVPKDANNNHGNATQSPKVEDVAQPPKVDNVASLISLMQADEGVKEFVKQLSLHGAQSPKVEDIEQSSKVEDVEQSPKGKDVAQSPKDEDVAQVPIDEDDNDSVMTINREIQLYGFPLSQPVRSVLYLLSEADVPFKIHPINTLKGEQKEPSYLKINPAGLIPCIVDGDVTVAESGAILTYIAESRFLDSWYPSDPAVRAKIQFWLHWNHSGTRTSSSRVLFPAFKKIDDPEGLSIFKKNIEFLEARLAETGEEKFVAGTTQPTIADCMLLPELNQLEVFQLFDYTPYPNVSKYIGRCHGAFKSHAENIKVVADFAASMAGPPPSE